MITKLDSIHQSFSGETLEQARDRIIRSMDNMGFYPDPHFSDETEEECIREANEYARESFPYLFDGDTEIIRKPGSTTELAWRNKDVSGARNEDANSNDLECEDLDQARDGAIRVMNFIGFYPARSSSKKTEEECIKDANKYAHKNYPHLFDEDTEIIRKPGSTTELAWRNKGVSSGYSGRQKVSDLEEKVVAGHQNSDLKEVHIAGGCTLCGLCDQPEVQDVFSYDQAGKLTVRHGGVVDIGKYPKVLELAELCPVKALKISEVHVLNQAEKGKLLDEFNQLVNTELRDYPFNVPEYYDYEYQTDTYQALPVPAKYRSEAKYLTDDTAENAGIAEFKRAVYSQYENIAKQYLTGYSIKKLRQFYTDDADSYYAHINSEISALLEKAYQLARAVVGDQFSILESICTFEVSPAWDECQYSREKLQNLGKDGMDLRRSSHYYDADNYRTWISTDGDFKSCYYDFAEAEKELRGDIDFAIWEKLEGYIAEDVKSIVKSYVKRAQAELGKRLAQLQGEVKKYVKVSSDSGQEFRKSIIDFCTAISASDPPTVGKPRLDDFDDQYNDNYRFSSLRACEKAAENRRERAYKEGLRFLEHLPSSLNEKWIESLSKLLTEWKRELLRIYDMNGRQYPNDNITIRSGAHNTIISLKNYDDVTDLESYAVFDYVRENLVTWACYGSVGGVSYQSEYSCEIITDYDCDFRETLFGDIKEVNKKYGYRVDLYNFASSANKVSAACTEELKSSDFLKKHFSDIKSQVVAEIHRVTGV